MRAIVLTVALVLAGCSGSDPACTAGAVSCDGTVQLACGSPSPGAQVAWLYVDDCAARPHAAGVPTSCYVCANATGTTCATRPSDAFCAP